MTSTLIHYKCVINHACTLHVADRDDLGDVTYSEIPSATHDERPSAQISPVVPACINYLNGSSTEVLFGSRIFIESV